jgi:DNA primase
LPFLRDGRQIGFLFLPEGEDPDSLMRREGPTAFQQRLAQATPLADYLFAELRTQADPDTLEGRARFAELARPLLEKLPEGHFRDLMAARLQQDAKLVQNRLRPPAPAPVWTADWNASLTRTPVRRAIALLLYRPALAATVPADDMVLRQSPRPGVALLVELIDLLQSYPDLHAAAILERYRDTRDGAILERLAQWTPEPELAEDQFGFEAEFTDILDYLRRQEASGKPWVETLLQRGKPSELSPEERDALRNFARGGTVQ